MVMHNVAEATETSQTDRRPLTQGLIDCDVHPLITDMSKVRNRMSKRAARRLEVLGHIGGAAREPNRVLHPTGPLRLDAMTPSGGLPGSDPEFTRHELLDPYGVTAAVLVPVQAAAVLPWGDEVAVGEYLAGLNDTLIEEWLSADTRYKLAISVSPHDAKSAVREVERLADVPGVVAINIPLAEVHPGRPALHDLYAAAEELELPVLMHPTGGEGNLLDAPNFAGGLVRTYPEHHIMLAQSGQAAVAGFVLGGVFERFPRLKLVFAEFGFSWVPSLMWRLDANWERTGGAEVTGLTRPPSEMIKDQVRFTTQPLDEPADRRQLDAVFDAVEAGRTLLFSSDYPHWDADDPLVIFNKRLPEPLRERIAWGSAVETFGRLDVDLP